MLDDSLKNHETTGEKCLELALHLGCHLPALQSFCFLDPMQNQIGSLENVILMSAHAAIAFMFRAWPECLIKRGSYAVL
jgi:hypothetical protein